MKGARLNTLFESAVHWPRPVRPSHQHFNHEIARRVVYVGQYVLISILLATEPLGQAATLMPAASWRF